LGRGVTHRLKWWLKSGWTSQKVFELDSDREDTKEPQKNWSFLVTCTLHYCRYMHQTATSRQSNVTMEHLPVIES
jgi:hypothetical protein